jgi:putative flippase GtrA
LLFRAVHGASLRDTQTGLRGVPRRLAEAMLTSASTGYEFELDMLISARQLKIEFLQIDIETVYIDNNASSHFNPLLDSMRIYFLLLRFSAASILTAICDNLVFYLALGWFGAALPSQIAGRLAAVVLNFNLNRRMVFLFREKGSSAIGRYLAVVAASGLISYLSLISLHRLLDMPLLTAKIVVESLLFLANFTILRDFVFVSGRSRETATDWTAYYRQVPWTARLTRRYTTRCLLRALRVAGLGMGEPRPRIFEFGGGNSCFLEPIAAEFPLESYHVMDTNPLGLDLLRTRPMTRMDVVLHQQNVMEMGAFGSADTVFSVGLIEHFDPPGTSRCIAAHFRNVKPGGWVLLSFPTATWLYRASRWLLEVLRLWRFPDERPLDRLEVLESARRYGTLTWEKTLWPLCLTQHMMLFQRTLETVPAQPLEEAHRQPA